MKTAFREIITDNAKAASDAEVAAQVKLFSAVLNHDKTSVNEQRLASEIVGIYAMELGVRTASAT